MLSRPVRWREADKRRSIVWFSLNGTNDAYLAVEMLPCSFDLDLYWCCVVNRICMCEPVSHEVVRQR
jgi:hypothetical protein